MAKKKTYPSPIMHSFIAKGARIERAAFRRAARIALNGPDAFLGNIMGIQWALDWFAGRAKRTRKPGGVGRLVLALTCLLLAPSVHAAPLDWTQGFSTDYLAEPAGQNAMWNPGTYTFDSSALNNHALWETGGDATGDGVMMLVNGRDDLSDSLVWGKVLNLDAPFQFFAKNLCCVTSDRNRPGPTLEFWLDGFKAGDILTDGAGHWDLFSFMAPFGPHLYEIRDGSQVFDGNDFALDSVGTVPTPEPASLALLGTGLFVAMWKRRRVA